MSQTITLKRDCHALVIPSGEPYVLRAGTPVVVTQSLGGSFTVQSPAAPGLFRIADNDADALGLASAGSAAPAKAAGAGTAGVRVAEEAVWERLRSCYDPEIPVNIVDLGLVYDLRLLPRPSGGCRVEVKMTLTAPGCGMGPAIAADAQQKLASLPGVTEAEVAVVWDPPWSADMMTPEGKRRLGMG
jgi:probable FeS assembly SUF system protein SufT